MWVCTLTPTNILIRVAEKYRNNHVLFVSRISNSKLKRRSDMWIIKWILDRLGSFVDIIRGDMEWYSVYSPVISTLILALSTLMGILWIVSPNYLIYGTLPFALVVGGIAGSKFQHKMDNEPAESSVREEMTRLLPYIQFQTVVIGIWIIYGILIWRSLQ
jgi:hypothetical protein